MDCGLVAVGLGWRSRNREVIGEFQYETNYAIGMSIGKHNDQMCS